LNYLYQLFSSFIVGIISFALSLFTARKANVLNFSQYSIALAIGSILAIAFDGGMRSFLTRERAKASDHPLELQNEASCRHGLFCRNSVDC
jgi:O-antigen/teichoic acid export membrane protein